MSSSGSCLREQGMAQWWECSPPTNVARVQIPASTSYVAWFCCWFSPLLRKVFSGYSGFPPPQKPTFPNSNSTRNQLDEEPLCGCATSKSLFIYLSMMSLAEWSLVGKYSETVVGLEILDGLSTVVCDVRWNGLWVVVWFHWCIV